MSIFRDYEDEVEIFGLVADESFHEIDLAPYLNDAGAKAVCIRGVRDDPPGTYQVSLKDIGQDPLPITSTKVELVQYFETIVGLSGGTSIEYKIAIDDYVRLFITGEVHAPAVIHPAALQYPVTEPAGGWESWESKAPTPIGDDVLSDIYAVLVKTTCRSLSSTYGIRQQGQDTLDLRSNWELGQCWWLVGLNENGLYEIKTTGKAGWDSPDTIFHEVGYIKKTGHNVYVDPVPWLNQSWFLPTTGASWGVVDFTSPPSEGANALPPNVATVGGRWRNGNANGNAFLRAIGAAAPTKVVGRKNVDVTQMVSLDDNLQCEYKLRRNVTYLILHWWELRDHFGASVRKLNDDEKLSANLSVIDAVTLRLASKKAVSLGALTSVIPLAIKSLKTDLPVSLNFAAKSSVGCR